MTFAAQINDVLRRVDFTDTENVVTLQQTFPTTGQDLWTACTDPGRLARWFEPVEGDLREGGRYRMVDSGTVGTIQECDAPRRLAITWEYESDVSRVLVSIEDAGSGAATLTVRHEGGHSEYWTEYGPAAGGSGWDAALLGLAMLIEDEKSTTLDGVMRRLSSSDGKQFVTDVVEQWAIAHVKAGAPREHATAAAQRALIVEQQQWDTTD
jgi:uncharacterized protein YndB with AHSA1/START domain